MITQHFKPQYNICLTLANVSRAGGMERMCVLLANELINGGHRIIIVSQNNYYWQKPFFKIDKGIKKYSMKRTILEWGICRLFKKKRYDIWKYRQILRQNHIQIIIDVDTELSLDSVMAKHGLGIKSISWEHFCYQRFINRDISQAIIGCIISEVDKMVVLTKTDKRLFTEKCGIPEEKIVQIYNPSPIEMSCYLPHNNKAVLAMGRFESEKGYDMLLDIWAFIEKNITDWKLEIVGEGSQENELKDKCSALGLKNVVFSPFTNNPYDKYLNASIYALPSRHEGFPLALLEAANMSLPIVAFDCPNGPREIVIDGVNGYLVEPDNVQLFADKLLSLIVDKEKRENFSKNALYTVENFKLSIILNEWEKLISSLVCNDY